jgi:hypothetical protein
MNTRAPSGQTPDHTAASARLTAAAAILALGLLLAVSPMTSGAAEPTTSLTASDKEQVQILRPRRRVVGRVTDDQTGQVIGQVTVIPVSGGNVNRSRATESSGKRLDVELEKNDSQLRFEADGYRTVTTPSFDRNKTVSLLDIRLKPVPAAAGRVVGPDGTPVAEAKVFLATKAQALNISLIEDQSIKRDAAVSDADGAFAFPPQGERHAVIAIHSLGYAETMVEPGQTPGDLKLAAWARIEGRLFEAGKPSPNTGVWLEPVRPRGLYQPQIVSGGGHETDEQGRFVFDRVPPVPCTLSVMVDRENRLPIRSGESVPLNPKPGQHITQNLGAGGAQVRGRVTFKGETADDLTLVSHSWNWLAPEGTDSRRLDDDGWPKSGIPLGKTRHHYFVKLASDGTFLISGVPAGEYNFAVAARGQGELVTSPYKVNPDHYQVVRFRVAESDVASGALDLGQIELEAPACPKPGELFPDFDFETLLGQNKKLSQLRGGYVLLDFSRRDREGRDTSPPTVGQIHDQYGTEGRLVVLGLTFYPETGPPMRQSIQQRPERWMQGFLPHLTDVVAQFGVTVAPTYFLIDPNGTLVSKHYTVEGAKKQIAALLDAAEPAAAK